MNEEFLTEVGEKYLDFVVTKHIPIEELQCTLRELTHLPTGAQVMHIANQDPENLFCLSFKTLPSSSNGVAHILEHSVLCGSKKFPVKDPFFSMSRRSLNTFMNALTGSDFTCYPAASQVEKDFYNLLDVYIDAVFHPQLKQVSFLQEGCRLEFSEPENQNSHLEFKGIVFNEMKGALATPDSRLWHSMMESLVPDLPYAYNSGGDPKDIPKLSYEELIQFHETYYHPSHCLFFFYGNFPLKPHLEFITENALKHVTSLPPLPHIQKQKRFTAPVKKTLKFPIMEDEHLSNRTIVSFGWLTCSLLEQEDLLALSILDVVLMDSDASPLKQRLLQSGLCTQVEAIMDSEMSEVPYLLTCKGCTPDKVEELEKVLFDSLKEIAKKPIPQHLIEAAIHQMEISRLEVVGDHAPFGLTLFLRSGLNKQHGCEPEQSLVIYSLFESLSIKTKDPYYLTSLLKKYLIDNTHRVRIVANPDTTLAQKESHEEKNTLEEIRLRLSESDKATIIKQTQELEHYQKQVETQCLDCLPTVTLNDVPVLSRDFLLHLNKTKQVEIFHHDCFTNHIVYADVVFDLPYVEESELPYLQLLLSLLPEVGCGKRSYIQNLEYIQAHTGGISVSSSLHVQATDSHLLKPCVVLRGKSLFRKTDKLFPLFKDLLTSADLTDKKRMEELLKQLHTHLLNRLPKHALRYAIQLALSGYTIPTHINHSCFGVRYYHTIQEICKNLESNLPALIERLSKLRDSIFCYHNPHLVLSCDQEAFQQITGENYYGLFSQLPPKHFTPWKSDYPLTPIFSQARTIATQVAYTVKAYHTVPYIHPHASALTIATQIFENKTLLHKVREQGGAYGAGANYSPTTGSFYFHSYRDPHILSTISAFDLAIDSVIEGKFSERDLEEAKLGIIQQFDSPISPGSRAISSYGWWRDNKPQKMRQEFRDALLNTGKKDVINAVAKELLPKKESAVVVTFGSKTLIEKENAKMSKQGKPLPVFGV